MPMKIDQDKRFTKIFNEPFYLLDLKSNQDGNYVFDVSGSTANIYQMTIYPEHKNVFCSCPDARSHAKRAGVVCKHACFVLWKVLKIQDQLLNAQYFQNGYLFTDTLLENISKRFQELLQIQSLEDEDFVNPEYLEKFQKIKDNIKDNKKHKKDEPPVSKYQLKKEIDDDLECMICFDNIKSSSSATNESIVECPLCHNLIHQECMKKWIKSGKKTCIYCRSPVWKDFGKEKSSDETIYSNLLKV